MAETGEDSREHANDAEAKEIEELHDSYKDFYMRGPREVLQRALDLAGVSITQLVEQSDESGVPSLPSFYRIRDGHTMMSLHHLYSIARALGIPTAALVPAVPLCLPQRPKETKGSAATGTDAYDDKIEFPLLDLESAWRPSIRVSFVDVPKEKRFRKHDGEETILVLDGEIEVDFRLDSGGPFRTERLKPHGFAQFAGFVVHSVVSVSETPARILRVHVKGGSAADRHLLNERWQRPKDEDELTERLVTRLTAELSSKQASEMLGSAAFDRINAIFKGDGKGARGFTLADILSFSELLNCAPGALVDDMYLFTVRDLPQKSQMRIRDAVDQEIRKNPHWESLTDETIRNTGLAPASDGGTNTGLDGDWWRRIIRASVADVDYVSDEVAADRLVAHEGEEVLYCLEGKLEVLLWRSLMPKAKPRYVAGKRPERLVPTSPDEVERVVVPAGEFLHFPSWIPHNVRAGDPSATARAVSFWVKSGVPASVTIPVSIKDNP